MSATYQRLGFSHEAAGLFVDEQGMDTLEELSIITDDECESLSIGASSRWDNTQPKYGCGWSTCQDS